MNLLEMYRAVRTVVLSDELKTAKFTLELLPRCNPAGRNEAVVKAAIEYLGMILREEHPCRVPSDFNFNMTPPKGPDNVQ